MAKILIVEDSRVDRHFVEHTIKEHGHEAIVATNGKEGYEMAKQHQPDLILMDIVMPGQSGFQTTRYITRDLDTNSIPVIMISSKNQQTDRVWAKRQGARDYLAKPFTKLELLNAIEAYL